MAYTGINDPQQVAGKTVQSLTEIGDYDYVLAFTDETYLRLGVEFGYYGDRTDLNFTPLENYRLFAEEGLKAGLVTPAEVEEYRQAERERQAAAKEKERELAAARELALYAALKRKYEE